MRYHKQFEFREFATTFYGNSFSLEYRIFVRYRG